MWYIGQKVVCVDDRFPRRVLEWTSNLPRKGQIYTIRWIGRGESLYTGESKFGLKLEELQTAERFGFFADRFAPLLEKLDEACQAKALELIAPSPLSPPMPIPRGS